ncbi:hypothetical protein PUN4_100010 [Paraburkholderia unamae]|nr:hypothetical protein [Paraburkholderia unamae]RAR65253.1 hypothetical protein C7401_104369 [Paraburkholderia unamae]CAG9243864.1 hypothetical protein PUN4_100010 [Paraburkholderia unamae]
MRVGTTAETTAAHAKLRRHDIDQLRYKGTRATWPAVAAQEDFAMICSHTTPLPDPLADPTRDPERDPLTPPSPGHHNDEPQQPEGPPDKDPV